jgi:6-phosphofructokinase 1
MANGRLGVLTGGGDTSALNATLKGIALEAERADYDLIGIEAGWAGMLKDGCAVRLPSSAIDANRGGTLIRTSRTNLRSIEGGIEQASERIRQLRLDGMIAIGGDDTLTVGVELGNYHQQIPINFVTKTIDNDVGTNPSPNGAYDFKAMTNYFCPGFPTAAAWLIRATDALRTTAYSHDRVLVLEAMGRTAGWLALSTAYGHPDFVVIPEQPLYIEPFIEKAAERYRERKHLVIVIAEGARNPERKSLSESGVTDSFGHARLGGCSEWLAAQLKTALGKERKLLSESGISHVIPSYLQRCGSPSSVDRDTAIELGRAAVRATLQGRDGMVACPILSDSEIVAATLPVDGVLPRDSGGTIIPRTVDPRLFDAENYAITATGVAYFEKFLGAMPEPYATPQLATYTG